MPGEANKVTTNLGRVSIVPKGVYDPAATYTRLDYVLYGDDGYLARKSGLKGVTPEEGESWMKAVGSGSAAAAKEAAAQAAASARSAAEKVDVLEENQEAIQSIRDNLTDIQAVSGGMEDVQAVSGALASVQTVGGSIESVNTAAGKIQDIQNVSTNMTAVKGVNDNMASVKTVAGANTNIQTVVTNLQAIKDAPDAAIRAEAAADAADLSAETAEEAAQRAQSIAQGAKGYYETPETLNESVPEGAAGDWAIVGSTDTIWVWDSDSGGWKDSHQATDLSNYYTKDQADEENNKLLAQITQETDEKLAGKANSTDLEPLETGITEAKTAAASATSRTWTCSVPATAWVSGSDTWSGISAGYKAEVQAEGMTEATQINGISFAGGDLTAAGQWRYLRPGAGKVTLYSEEKPGKDFSLVLTEVK